MFIADTHSDTLFNLARGAKLDEVDITPARLHDGGVTLQVFAMWSGPKGPDGDYAALAEKEYAARQQFIDVGITQVDDPSEAKTGKPHFMLSLEGCEVFQDGIEKVAFWRERGVRMGAGHFPWRQYQDWFRESVEKNDSEETSVHLAVQFAPFYTYSYVMRRADKERIRQVFLWFRRDSSWK